VSRIKHGYVMHKGVVPEAQLATGAITAGAVPVATGTGTATWGTLSMSGTAATTSITDAGGYFTGTDVEAALQELAAMVGPFVDDGGGTWKFAPSQNEIADEDVNAYLFMPGAGTGNVDLNATGEMKLEANDGSAGGPDRAKHNLVGGHGVIFPELAADPSGTVLTGVGNLVYFNATTHKHRAWDGTAWHDLW
jgi:hypothetical protein